MGLFVRGQRCDLIDIARSISVAIAFYGGGREGRNYDFDKRLTDGFEDLNGDKLWDVKPVLFTQNRDIEGFKTFANIRI